MNIVQAIVSRGFAGSERHAAELSNILAQRHRVTLLIRKHNEDLLRKTSIESHIEESVRVIRVPSLLRGTAIRSALRRLRPDIVHTHLGRASRLIGRLALSAPKVATLHIDYRAKDYAHHDGLICVARWQTEDIPATFGGEIRVINNWVRPHRRLSKAEIAEQRRLLGVKPSTFLLGSVGQLRPPKAYEVLIRAFQRAGLDNAILVIVGDGPERPHLDSLADGHVRLVGFRDNAKDLPQVFDVFVSSSRFEPFALVLLEAMDAGAPIIATRCDGTLEMLGGQALELVPIDDIEAMTAAIRRAYEARPGRVRYDMERFSLGAKLTEIEDFYEALISRRAR